MKRESTTSILSQNNKACNGTNESINCHFITLHSSVFSMSNANNRRPLKMHKIFIAQKSHCTCRVLSLATVKSKYYFNLQTTLHWWKTRPVNHCAPQLVQWYGQDAVRRIHKQKQTEKANKRRLEAKVTTNWMFAPPTLLFRS